jgi:hypothetical protein
MSKTLLAAAALTLAAVAAALSGSAQAGVLNCEITIDGAQVATCATSSTGSLSFSSGVVSPLFSSISLTADGPPVLPNPDLSTVTLDVSSSAGFSGTHVLGVDVFQTGVSAPAGTTLESTATINGLINLPGPTTLSDAFNGTASTLGTTLRSSTFASTFTGAVGPFFDVLTVPLTADAEQYLITFTAPNQSANDTIQLQGVIPSVDEPTSLALLGSALVGFGLWHRRRSA